MRGRALPGLWLALSVSSAYAANITITNTDPAGQGFNDTTPFTPVGGNSATTLGQARTNVFQRAATLWGQKIGSTQTIVVSARWVSLQCSQTSGTLGQAGPNAYFKNFANAPFTNVYYPVALADALANQRIDTSGGPDVTAEFNLSVDSNPNCLGGVGFYYGLDNTPGGKIDLLNTLMHEFGHGLGFASFVDETTGQGTDPNNPNQLGIYDQFVFDETQNKFWPQLTATQRVSSAVNDTHLVWNGARVNAARSYLTAGVTAAGHVRLFAPNPDQPGSSVSHWDSVVSPNLLMEPFDNPNVKAINGVDFTACAFADMGWQLMPGIDCPDNLTGNSAPVANAQSVQTNQDTQLAITLTGSDANGDPLTYRIQTSPAHGSLGGTAPNVLYTPATGYVGADSFSFSVDDGKIGSAPATVSITVKAANRAPVASAQSVAVTPDTAKAIVLAATDPDGDALSYSIVATPAHGALSGTPPNVTYTPNAGYTGADSFTFKANDGALDSNVATVSLSVSAPAPAGGGGGGAMPPLFALLALWGLRRLRMRRA